MDMFSPDYSSAALHSSFGVRQSSWMWTKKDFSWFMTFDMPKSRVSKVLVQKDGAEGHYITEFFLKYKPISGNGKYKDSNEICYNECKPIKTNMKATDAQKKVHSFILDKPFLASEVMLYAKAPKDKPVAGRFDLVVEPKDPEMKPKFFPKVVSMFKDRADQIKTIKVNSAYNDKYNERFDLLAPNGFGAASKKVKKFYIDIELYTNQQVAGVVFRQPSGESFTSPNRVVLLYKVDSTKPFGGFSTKGINFAKGQTSKFEYRRKIFRAPWGKFIRVQMYNDGAKFIDLAMGGKFDLLLTNGSE